MPLSPGTRFGACEVLSALGAGGMGEVYRAGGGARERDRPSGPEAGDADQPFTVIVNWIDTLARRAP